MSIHFPRSTGICATCLSAFVFLAAPATTLADGIPFTSVDVQVTGGATGGNFQDQQNPTNVDGPSSASVSKGAIGSDGATASASASGFADFGTLGVGGIGSGLTPPASSIAGASSSVLISAFWDDFLTAFPNAGSLLVPGTPVNATLALDLDFENSLLAIDNAQGALSYELFADIVFTDPNTGVRSISIVLDDCFVVDPDFKPCNAGSHVIGIPGNTNGQPLSVQLDPVALPLAILQPFELSVSLAFNGQCTAGPNETAASSCSFDGNALHTSTATLQPLGDFTLVAASGHDYSLPVTTPPGNVPEPGSLALIVSGLVPAALSLLRRRKADGRRPPSRNAG